VGQKSHSCFIHLAGLFSVQRGPRRVQVHGIPTTRARTNLTKRNCRSLPLQCCFGPTPAFSQQIPARAKQTLPRFPRGNLRRRGHDTVRFGIVPSFAPPPRAPPDFNVGRERRKPRSYSPNLFPSVGHDFLLSTQHCWRGGHGWNGWQRPCPRTRRREPGSRKLRENKCRWRDSEFGNDWEKAGFRRRSDGLG